VEFGAKVNMIQVDGINFIEHLNFNAFNEGPRLIDSIWYSRSLFGKITHISAELRKERATRMEGSFGTEKQHYSLDKIKARTEKNEILWIFFGVHTASAVRIAKRLAQEKSSQIAA